MRLGSIKVAPPPPVADLALPWDAPVADAVAAVAAVAAARAEHGDTFAAVSGGDTYLFCFSPTGVESFYALPEDVASKGVADYLMLRRKLPDEVFADRRTLPGQLFLKGDVATYLAALELALDAEVAALGWVMVDLLAHPGALARVRAGEEGYAARCALESTRLAQRSIMSRHVMQPLSLDTGKASYEVGG